MFGGRRKFDICIAPSRKRSGMEISMSVYSTKEIMEIIPHRHPFLLIDTIEELEPGVRAVGRKCVSANEPYFQGHFPEFRGHTAYFAGIDKAKFRQKVLPGDVLELETAIVKVKGPIGIGQAVAKVNGKVAAQAQLTFAIS